MSRERTLLFGSLLMSLVALVGGALFDMHPDGALFWPWLTDTTARPVATERVSPDWVGREP